MLRSCVASTTPDGESSSGQAGREGRHSAHGGVAKPHRGVAGLRARLPDASLESLGQLALGLQPLYRGVRLADHRFQPAATLERGLRRGALGGERLDPGANVLEHGQNRIRLALDALGDRLVVPDG